MVDTTRDSTFLRDEQGKKTHVLLPIDVYEALLEAVEDAGLLRAMQEADGDEVLTLEQALAALAE
ncbi:hypothetical protein BH24DEI2_BH24DEI2_18710 [soil metagenome]